ncbi:HTH-type transcriptional regulator GltC [Actinomadura rubteroloni]|uniref:HTH-type transcriptional regulator GltC n=1 Tax=Actinomadura rubteroloni TaxID=1926885 RepID=A0A2P4UCM4_9ACTN|nr:LysR family transcriptional regulator [Actinomadura rubteroloni]POM22803.1 HTH-type transcriptional regulator GltC [Actinomadura rubteroloni]
MELRQLGHFVAVAEERHFTRAARRVHLVQSSLSSSLRALERELGAELLVRNSRRVELTEAGRALLPAARRALAAARDGRDAVDAVRGLLRGHLAIGAIQSFGAIDPLALIARYHRAYPGVTLRLRTASVDALAAAVADGELDVAFLGLPMRARPLRLVPVATESVVLAVPADDPLAEETVVDLAGLGDREFVEFRADSALRALIDRRCAEIGLHRRASCEVDLIPDLVDLIAEGLGIALVPRSALRRAGPRVVAVGVEPEIPFELAVATAADRPPAPATAAFLAMLPGA